MRYLRAEWRHSFPDEPVTLYSEIDSDGWEMRKVYVFSDGRVQFADTIVEMGGTRLADQPIELSVEEINAMPDFSATEIAKEDFDRVWLGAVCQPGRFTLLIVPAIRGRPLRLTDTRRMARALLELQPAFAIAAVSDSGGAFRVTGSPSADVAPGVLDVIAETVGDGFRIEVTTES